MVKTALKYEDDNIVHKEDDLEKIQTSPGMYISYTGAKGSLHLCKEITNNMVDECINTKSPANTIDLIFDEPTSEFACRDNGRGIPHESLEVVCTKIQSSGKFGRRGSGGASAGQNGI